MSIRLRLAAAFALIAAILFAIGGWLFADSLSTSLLSNIDAQLATQAAQASQYVSPTTGALSNPTHSNNRLEYIVQLVDSGGQVVASSGDAERRAILTSSQLSGARQGRIFLTATRDGESVRVLAEPFASRPGWVVVAGVSLETRDATLHQVEIELIVGGIAFVVAAALGALALGTAALRPVERLRREAAALSRTEGTGAMAVPRTHDEVAALAETMNDLLVGIHGALQRERNLIADASHELRTPFAVLQGELELAARPGRSKEELQTAIVRASEEAGRLARLTDDLLLLSRSDQGHLDVDRRATDVADFLAMCASHAAARALAAGVSCRVEVPDALVWELDAGRIRQAIDNLVDNALRYAPAGSSIILTARIAGGDLVLSVADEGPGFPPDYLVHAFERFRRTDASRSRGQGGAGLGLAIVRAIAMAHGGTATVQNRQNGGAEVTLRLPGPHGP